MRRSRFQRWVGLVLCAGLGAACQAPSGGLHVVVEGPFRAGVDFDLFSLITARPSGEVLLRHELSGENLPALPFGLNLLSGPKTPVGTEVVVTASIYLAERVVSQISGSGALQAGAGGLVELVLPQPGPEPTDGGTDAGESTDDAGSSDAGSDAGSVCASCVSPPNGRATCDGGACGFACNVAYHECGGACAANASVNSCGTSCSPCSPPTNGTATCDGGACGFVCNVAYHECGGGCAANASINSCGTSCSPCSPPANSAAACDGGACGFACNVAYHECGGACVANASVNSCGTSCSPCSPPANSAATCDGGACGFVCDSQYHACGGACASNASVNSCGASCSPCSPPGSGTAICDGGACGFVCPGLFDESTSCLGASVPGAGWFHSCALIAGGGVKCWGHNLYGQIGDGTTVQPLMPVTVAGLSSGATAIAAGGYHACALLTGGVVKCWGYNSYGQLGDGTTGQSPTPVAVSGLPSAATVIAAGGNHSCAIVSGGAVMCWGYNSYGQLGDGTTTLRSTPVPVSGLASGATALSAGAAYTCALVAGGAVKCWGHNTYGQLGDGTSIDRPTPVTVSGISSGATAVAAGSYHACAIAAGGAAKCWGYNPYGQVGDGTTTQRLMPVAVVGFSTGTTTLAPGTIHTCAIAAGGVLKCWGYNGYGAVGDGTTSSSVVPVAVSGLSSGVTAVGTGGYHTCAVVAGGAMKCWGLNLYGQIGDGTTTQRLTPTNIVSP